MRRRSGPLRALGNRRHRRLASLSARRRPAGSAVCLRPCTTKTSCPPVFIRPNRTWQKLKSPWPERSGTGEKFSPCRPMPRRPAAVVMKADSTPPPTSLPAINFAPGGTDPSIVTPEMLVGYLKPSSAGKINSSRNNSPAAVVPVKLGFTPPAGVPARVIPAVPSIKANEPARLHVTAAAVPSGCGAGFGFGRALMVLAQSADTNLLPLVKVSSPGVTNGLRRFLCRIQSRDASGHDQRPGCGDAGGAGKIPRRTGTGARPGQHPPVHPGRGKAGEIARGKSARRHPPAGAAGFGRGGGGGKRSAARAVHLHAVSRPLADGHARAGNPAAAGRGVPADGSGRPGAHQILRRDDGGAFAENRPDGLLPAARFAGAA